MAKHFAEERAATRPEIVERFAEHLVRRRRSSATVVAYSSDVQLFMRAHGGDGFPASVKPSELIAFVEGARANRTRQRRTASLRAFFRWARRAGECTENPALDLERPRDRRPDRTALSPRDLALFMRAVFERGTPRDKAILAILVETGVQSHELLRLRPNDFEKRSNGALVRIRGRGRRARVLPLSPAAVAAVDEWIAARPRRATALFVNMSGSAGYEPAELTSRSLTRVVRRYGYVLAGVEITPRVLRGTFERMCAAEGRTLAERRRLLGHADTWVTQLYALARWRAPRPAHLRTVAP